MKLFFIEKGSVGFLFFTYRFYFFFKFKTRFTLDAPTCKPNQTKVYGVAKEEKAHISCEVDANPTNLQFRWIFNSSALSVDVAQNYITRSGTSSVISYTPVTEQDYGTLLCYASNEIGHQRVPCAFHIIAAGESFFSCR